MVQLLLNRGALLHRDHNGRNPLHLAAMSGYTQTIELLHSVHSHLLDQVDKDGVSTLTNNIFKPLFEKTLFVTFILKFYSILLKIFLRKILNIKIEKELSQNLACLIYHKN